MINKTKKIDVKHSEQVHVRCTDIKKFNHINQDLQELLGDTFYQDRQQGDILEVSLSLVCMKYIMWIGNNNCYRFCCDCCDNDTENISVAIETNVHYSIKQ